MINFDSLLGSLPQQPSYTGQWAPVYLEPMMGSGERLTVAVAAIGDDGQVDVRQAIRPHVLEAMFGEQNGKISKLVGLVIANLRAHASLTREFPGWKPPISGVTLGKVRPTRSSDISGLLRQAVAMTASLAALDLNDSGEVEPSSVITPSDDRWPKQFQAEAMRRDSRLEQFFMRKLAISEPSKPLNIFFLSETVALNTGRLIPGAGLSAYLEHNKARMLDLRVAKEKQSLFVRNHFELVVFRPSFDDPTYSLKQIDSLKRSIATLEAACDESRIRVTQVQSAAEAAERLLQVA